MQIREQAVQDAVDIFSHLTAREKTIFLAATKRVSPVMIPVSVFHTNLSTLQAVVYYLKHHLHLSTSNIASSLHRKPSTISMTYRAASAKLKGKMNVSDTSFTIPLTIFMERSCAPLEALILFFKETHYLKLVEIADLLHKNRNTIKSTHGRYKK